MTQTFDTAVQFDSEEVPFVTLRFWEYCGLDTKTVANLDSLKFDRLQVCIFEECAAIFMEQAEPIRAEDAKLGFGFVLIHRSKL